ASSAAGAGTRSGSRHSEEMAKGRIGGILSGRARGRAARHRRHEPEDGHHILPGAPGDRGSDLQFEKPESSCALFHAPPACLVPCRNELLGVMLTPVHFFTLARNCSRSALWAKYHSLKPK